MKKIIQFAFVFIFLLTFSSCKREENKLLPAEKKINKIKAIQDKNKKLQDKLNNHFSEEKYKFLLSYADTSGLDKGDISFLENKPQILKVINIFSEEAILSADIEVYKILNSEGYGHLERNYEYQSSHGIINFISIDDLKKKIKLSEQDDAANANPR